VECADAEGSQGEGEDGASGMVIKARAWKYWMVCWENFMADGTGRGYEETRHAELPVRKGVKVGLNMWSSGRIDESLSAPSTASLEKSSCPFSAPRSNYRTAASPVEAVAMPTRHTRTVTVEIGKHRPISLLKLSGRAPELAAALSESNDSAAKIPRAR
jgi:hypothetical protein